MKSNHCDAVAALLGSLAASASKKRLCCQSASCRELKQVRLRTNRHRLPLSRLPERRVCLIKWDSDQIGYSIQADASVTTQFFLCEKKNLVVVGGGGAGGGGDCTDSLSGRIKAAL